MLSKIKNFLIKNELPACLKNDEGLQRILCTVPGMLDTQNVPLMLQAIQEMPEKGAVLEIGSFCGQSLIVLCYLLRKEKQTRKVFACDAWLYEGWLDKNSHVDASYLNTLAGFPEIQRNDYTDFLYDSFKRNLNFFFPNDLPGSYRELSLSFLNYWTEGKELIDCFDNKNNLGGEIAFAFIDGGHAYDLCKQELELLVPHFITGSKILLDDSAKGQNFGSARLAQEIKSDARFSIISAKGNLLFEYR